VANKNKSQMSFILGDVRELLALLPGFRVEKVNRARNCEFVMHITLLAFVVLCGVGV
jgi:hypothetical protein